MSQLSYKASVLRAISVIDAELIEYAGEERFSYKMQRNLIERSFINNLRYDVSTVIIRLTLIDSLYSTNAAYSYFSIEEMAERLVALGTEQDLRDYFYALATGGRDSQGLFTEAYGIRKNLSEGSRQMSLLSKYANYALIRQAKEYPRGFPIYDSLAIETYPLVARGLGKKPQSKGTISQDIACYISALETLRHSLFDDEGDVGIFSHQDFDLLDAYLWRIGKMNGGNYSLLLDRQSYHRLIEQIGLRGVNVASTAFDKEVRRRCCDLGEQAIRGVEDEAFRQLYLHWLEWYA